MKSNRRDFLKSAGVGGVGLGLGGWSPLAFAQGSATKDRHLLPPDILPVVFLSGSDFEMGYQYGQQAAAHVYLNTEASWASALERLSHDEVRKGTQGLSVPYSKTHSRNHRNGQGYGRRGNGGRIPRLL